MVRRKSKMSKKKRKYLIGEIVIYVRKRPRYNDGWKYCCKCGLSFKPSIPLPYLNRCPFCGRSLRAGVRRGKWGSSKVVKP